MTGYPSLRWLRVAAAPMLLVLVVVLAGPQRVLETLHGADPGWLALGLLANIAGNVIAALRWRELSRWLGLTAQRAWAVVLYFHGIAVNALLPGAVVGGDMLRIWALQRLGNPAPESGLSVLLDRTSGLWMLFVVGLCALAWGADTASGQHLATRWPAVDGWILRSTALAIAFAAVLAPWAVLMVIPRWLPNHESPRLARFRVALGRAHAGRHYLTQVVLSTIVQALAIASLVCAAHALRVDVAPWAMAVCAVPIFVMATLPVSFGGWGTREAAAAFSLGAFGVAAPAAVTISMIYGIYQLLQATGGLMRVPGGAPVAVK